jgi:hypothetical protein
MRKYSAMVIAVLLLATSCKENTRVNLVSGFVFQDCASPLPNVEIALKSNVEGSFSSQIILGSGITAADGSLRFTYELDEEDLGSGSLLLVKSTGFETLIDDIELNQDVSLNLFRNDFTSLVIELSGSKVFASNDTLYYGVAGNEFEYFKVQPSNGAIDTIQVLNSTPNKNNVSEVIYYGVGSSDFNKSREAVSITDSTFNNQNVVLNGCGTVTNGNLVID